MLSFFHELGAGPREIGETMRTIRSLLWIGSGRGLSESGVTEAPELDVTWVPDVEEAELLPRVH